MPELFLFSNRDQQIACYEQMLLIFYYYNLVLVRVRVHIQASMSKNVKTDKQTKYLEDIFPCSLVGEVHN